MEKTHTTTPQTLVIELDGKPLVLDKPCVRTLEEVPASIVGYPNSAVSYYLGKWRKILSAPGGVAWARRHAYDCLDPGTYIVYDGPLANAVVEFNPSKGRIEVFMIGGATLYKKAGDFEPAEDAERALRPVIVVNNGKGRLYNPGAGEPVVIDFDELDEEPKWYSVGVDNEEIVATRTTFEAAMDDAKEALEDQDTFLVDIELQDEELNPVSLRDGKPAIFVVFEDDPD